MPTDSASYLDTADIAKMIRKMLKAAFPTTTFSVRSSRYAGGSSIDIRWADGPTARAVDALVKPLEGASFHGMIDLQTYNGPSIIAGARVKFGVHYIFTQRESSRALLEFALAEVCRMWACKPCGIKDSTYTPGRAYTDGNGDLNVGNGYLSTADLVNQLAAVTSAIGGEFAYDVEDRPSPREVTDRLSADRAEKVTADAFRAVFPELAAAAALNPAREPEAEPAAEVATMTNPPAAAVAAAAQPLPAVDVLGIILVRLSGTETVAAHGASNVVQFPPSRWFE